MPIWERATYYGNHDFYLTIPCGRCALCKSKLAKEWKVRLHYELNSCPKHRPFGNLVPRALFCTLTLNDNYVTEDERFFAPWFVKFRDNYRKKYKCSPRYWATTDRGSQFGRLHVHFILFNPVPSANQFNNDLRRWYNFGFVEAKWLWSNSVDEYLTGYVSGDNLYKDNPVKHGKPVCEKALKYKPRIFVSKGLGRDCPDKDYILSRGDNMVDINGFTYSLPRYYRDKWLSYTERYYYRLINLLFTIQTYENYDYNIESIPHKFKGRLINYSYKDFALSQFDRFTTSPKEKIVTDWSQVVSTLEYQDEDYKLFMDGMPNELYVG